MTAMDRGERRMVRAIGVGLAAIGCLVAASTALLVLSVVTSAAHDIVSDDDVSNDWIMGLRNKTNELCCGFNDCYPVEPTAVRLVENGRLAVKINSEWFEVGEEFLMTARSQDGRAWVCPRWHFIYGGYMKAITGVRCLLLPPLM
jgi:hypothetical protein